ncbi:MAG: hypothetical protein ACRELY_08750 [Polyangiaceae bacterium]
MLREQERMNKAASAIRLRTRATLRHVIRVRECPLLREPSAPALDLRIDGAHRFIMRLLHAPLVVLFDARRVTKAGAIALPETENDIGLLLSLDHDVLESLTLFEHRKHARRELAARTNSKTTATRKRFYLATIETVHAVAIRIRLQLPRALQASHVLIGGAEQLRCFGACDPSLTRSGVVHACTPVVAKTDFHGQGLRLDFASTRYGYMY